MVLKNQKKHSNLKETENLDEFLMDDDEFAEQLQLQTYERDVEALEQVVGQLSDDAYMLQEPEAEEDLSDQFKDTAMETAEGAADRKPEQDKAADAESEPERETHDQGDALPESSRPRHRSRKREKRRRRRRTSSTDTSEIRRTQLFL